MKYYKFEKIQKGENPIIRITFKKLFGGFVVRDVCKSTFVDKWWVCMDNGEELYDNPAIVNFHNNDADVYFVNGK